MQWDTMTDRERDASRSNAMTRQYLGLICYLLFWLAQVAMFTTAVPQDGEVWLRFLRIWYVVIPAAIVLRVGRWLVFNE